MRRSHYKAVARLLTAIVVAVVFLSPFIYMLIGALSRSFPLTGLIDFGSLQLTLDNVTFLFSRAQLHVPVLNSLLVAIVVTICNVLFCTLTGYVLARREFRFRSALIISVLLVLMIPAHVVIIPMYLITRWFGIYDTYLALILPFAVTPLGIFLMRQYILGLPTDLEDAARLEGASEFTIIWKVVMPLCRPALAVLAVQVFLVNWNSFLYPFILTSSEQMRTLPVALAMLQGYQNIDVPQIFAASVVSALPTTLLFLAFSRRITEGIIAGALRG